MTMRDSNQPDRPEQPPNDDPAGDEGTDDGAQFRCMWCHSAALVHQSIETPLPPEAQYPIETPYGPDIWMDVEIEEVYLCLVCGTHCTVDEVYWWQPGDPDPFDEAGGQDG